VTNDERQGEGVWGEVKNSPSTPAASVVLEAEPVGRMGAHELLEVARGRQGGGLAMTSPSGCFAAKTAKRRVDKRK